MPEGDVVYQAARRLDAALAGRIIETNKFRLPGYGTLDLTGCRVNSAVSRGKHLLLRVADVSIHTHMAVMGRWDVYATGERSRTPAVKASVVLKNDAFQAVGFDLEYMRVIRTSDEPQAVGHLGPDPLGHSWDPAEAERRLASNPERPIGLALLDQRLIAGLGKVYRSEILFLACTNPRTPVGEVEDLARIVDLAHRLMEANKDRPMRSTTPATLDSPYSVFARGGEPCLRCSDPVVHERFGPDSPLGKPVAAVNRGRAGGAGRAAVFDDNRDLAGRDLFWCPQCQPLPGQGTVPEPGRAADLGSAGSLPG